MSGHGARRWTIAALAGIGAAVAASAGLALADPPAGFTVSAERPVPGETVTFTAQAACAAPVDCAWDFGDGAGAAGREVAHAFAVAGPQTVTLTVSDPGDAADPSVATAVVRVDAGPTAAFSVDPASPRKHDTVTFDGRASSDPDGDALAYRWDFDGDGAQDAEGAEITHSYPAAGTFQATLTVDDGLLEHVAFATVTVRSIPPSAAITPSSATPLTGQSVTFTGMGTDADGAIAAWAWDLDDDGAFDDASTPAAAATFATPGRRTVGLRVTDDDGETATTELSIAVLNRDPVAAFTFTPDPVPQEQPVTFASQSTDPEGRLAAEAWDLDGDGAYDDATGATRHGHLHLGRAAHHRPAGHRPGRRRGGEAARHPARQRDAPGRLHDLPGPPAERRPGDVQRHRAGRRRDDRRLRVGPRRGRRSTTTDGRRRRDLLRDPRLAPVRLRVVDDDGGAATAEKTFSVVNRPPVAAFVVPT